VSELLRSFPAVALATGIALTANCARRSSPPSDPTNESGVAPDAATPSNGPDAGVPLDGGSAPDAGTVKEACVGPDAGTPAALEVLPCPGAPPVVWNRTFPGVDVDFRGTADENSNLYWIEYDPPWSYQNPNPPAFLVSADSNGQNRRQARRSAASCLPTEMS
jgi:hypothetical protein